MKRINERFLEKINMNRVVIKQLIMLEQLNKKNEEFG